MPRNHDQVFLVLLCCVLFSSAGLANLRASHLPCGAACGSAPDIWQEHQRRQHTEKYSHHQHHQLNAVQTRTLLSEIYQQVMQTTVFTADEIAYGQRDIYPTPAQLEAARLNGQYRGDCTTFAHRFYYALIEHGIAAARIKRIRIDTYNRPGKVSNHMAVLVDDTYVLDNAAPGKQVVRFEQLTGTPKMWLSEDTAGWYQGALGQAPLTDTHFKGFSLLLHTR